jgi:hypothetical protein
MAGRDMPPEHPTAPPTFEANHVVLVTGSPDRHRGCSLTVDFGCRFSETHERPVHGRDERPELVGPDLVPPNKRSGDFRSEFSLDRCGRCFVGASWLSLSDRYNSIPG